MEVLLLLVPGAMGFYRAIRVGRSGRAFFDRILGLLLILLAVLIAGPIAFVGSTGLGYGLEISGYVGPLAAIIGLLIAGTGFYLLIGRSTKARDGGGPSG